MPWNAIGGGGFFSFQWLSQYPLGPAAAPALIQLLRHGRLWFLPLFLALLAALVVFIEAGGGCDGEIASGFSADRYRRHSGAIGVAAIALAIDINGWAWNALAKVFGELPRRQPGLGYGALCVSVAWLMLLCTGLALRGWVKGDAFVAGAIGVAISLVALFTLYPLARMFLHAFLDPGGNFSLGALLARVASSKIWGFGGIVWNTPAARPDDGVRGDVARRFVSSSS